MKWFLILLTVIYTPVAAQHLLGARQPLPGEESEYLFEYQNSQPGIQQVEALLNLGAYYIYLPGEEKDDLEKGLSYARQAHAASVRLNFRDGLRESIFLIGTALQEGGDWRSGQQHYDSLQKVLLPEYDNLKSLPPERQLMTVLLLGKIYFSWGYQDYALYYFTELITLCKTRAPANLQYIYWRLSLVQIVRDDLGQALSNGMEAIKHMEAGGDRSFAGNLYYNLARIYRILGQYEKAVEYGKLAHEFFRKQPSGILYELAAFTAEAFTKINRAKDGVAHIKENAKFYPPTNDFAKRNVARSLAVCYRVLEQYDSSEVHLLKLIQLLPKDKPGEIMDVKKDLGQLYIEWGRYAKAKPYLDECLTSKYYGGRALAHLYFMCFKADSAAGNYLLALEHLRNNKDIDEQIYQEWKVKVTKEMEVKYESEKKDKDLHIKEQDIQLLTNLSQLQQQRMSQAQLKFSYDSVTKEQSIQFLSTESAKKDKDLLLKQQRLELLAKQDQLKRASLQNAALTNNITLGGIALLLIILALLYNQYRIKQNNNKEISNNNLTLQHLLDEKEWLLKEVHHRVKNNLHTIMSLLQSQSAYLKDDALLAVQNSQHRVYAMSLIHQKLYQHDNSTSINMLVYLPELLDYLRESFDVKHRIQFLVDIMDLRLDISKAIPVGLILNEAVTNAIKYAFPHGSTGAIHIGMHRLPDNRIRLTIADNGIGIPDNWNTLQRDSLGLKLIRGLSDDLRGKFKIEKSNGTIITIAFSEELFAHEPQRATKKTGVLQS